jgi:VWFA-related protein
VLVGSNTKMEPANLVAQPRPKAFPHRAIHNLGIALLLCTIFYTQHSGGDSKPSPQVQQPTIPMLDEGKGLIHLDVSVTKPDGEPVAGLTRENFELLDERLDQRILSFHALSGQSVQVILLLDTLCKIYPSCMSKADASRAQAGIETFLAQDNGHLHQPVSIFGISDDGLWTLPHHDLLDGNSLVTDLSSDKRIILDRRPDALRALAYIATAQRRTRGRKVMLWIGPGCGKGTGIFPASHNQGQKTFDPIYWFATLFREARMSIDELPVDQAGPCAPGYELYLSGPRTVHEANDRFLYKKVLAMQSGGSVANDANDLVAAMNRCLSALNFYTLSFVPPIAVEPHEYHSLQVRVDKPGSVVHTNTGYYDEPFYSDQPTAALTANFRNRNLQRALAAVAGLSAFLGQPPAEIPNLAAPDAAAKQHMLVLVKDYLERTISKLPDFYATRTTVHYEEMPELDNGKNRAGVRPLRVVEQSKARVLYRDGDEAVESEDFESLSSERLTTHGTFGPILADVRRAVETPDRMKWVHWDSGPEGSRGVFEFEVPAAESTYFEGGCCLPDAEGQNSFHIQAGYRVEIAINPDDGTIFRLQQQFDMQDFVPMDRDEVLVDYGPVKIGGKTYFCPARSVSLARGRSTISLKLWDQSFLSYGPYSTKMNDMRFSNYHLFRAESRILPGFKPDK